MPILISLFMNLIVIMSSFIITYRLFRIGDFVDSLICWFILYFAQIVFTELLLGVPGMLYLNNVILLNLAVLLLIVLVARNKGSSFNLKGTKEACFKLMSDRVVLLGVSIILGFGLVKVFINLINPPFGWDNLNYHFSFPVEWLKHGNLANPITVFDDPSPSYYPINGSLFFLWLVFPLKNVFLADLGQLPFFILAFLTAYKIAKRVGLDKLASFYSVALFSLVPNYFKQLQIAYVDMMVAALFLVCLNSLFLLNERFSRENTLVYGISFGLLLGAKTVALPYCALLFLPFCYLLLKNIKKARLFLHFALAVIIFGGFSYLKNFIDTGNPLYPLDFNLFNKNILKGVIDNSIYGAHFKITDYRIAKLLFHEGLGAQSLIFIIPGMFLALPLAIIKKRKALNFNLIYFLVLPLLIYLAYRYIIPLANTRYLYPLLSIGIIIGFYFYDRLNIPKRIINVLVAICMLASMSELAKRQELTSGIVMTIFLFLFLPQLMKFARNCTGCCIPKSDPSSRLTPLLGMRPSIKSLFQRSQFVKRPFVIFAFPVILICFLIMCEKYYIKNEYPRYLKMVKYSGFWPDAARAWDWLNSNTVGNNIAYVGRPVPFPLYGTNFKNNVYYVSVNKTDPAKLHYFPNSRYKWDDNFLNLHRSLEAKGNYRFDADYSVWLNNLARRKTDYLFVYSLHQTKDIEFPLEDGWARVNSNKFIPVFANNTIHIYKILH